MIGTHRWALLAGDTVGMAWVHDTWAATVGINTVMDCVAILDDISPERSLKSRGSKIDQMVNIVHLCPAGMKLVPIEA